MQSPLLSSLEGGGQAALWDAQAACDIAGLIAQYLTAHPPPAGSRTGQDWHRYVQDLCVDGRLRLEALGQAGHLRAVAAA